ncbi:AraC family transcriptional regulator [Paenibacillus sp. FSL H8-0034]|uniref:AraC family transcriptional regulator n=1 Tax=Paenibacillus sp. FSL H8-0034 TaxID=2954671 RepID=UPI0030FCE865
MSSSQGYTSSTVQTDMQLSLFVAEQASYVKLNIEDKVYPHWIVSYVLEGTVETVTEGVSSQLGAGCVMIHPPHVPFSERSHTSGVHLWVAFQAEYTSGLDLFRLYPVPLVFRLQSSELYCETFQKLLVVWGNGSLPFRDLLVTAYVYELLSELLKQWDLANRPLREKEARTEQDRFTVVIRYMMEKYAQKLSREQLAVLVHLHPVYFDRIFLETYQVTPMQMLRDIRLRQSKKLLECTTGTMQSIAMACGFGDAPYFNRIFRKMCGQTPGEYREQMRLAREHYMNKRV